MSDKTKLYIPELTDVSETLLVPLYFKAKETLENGIIKDNAAVEIVNKIQYNFDKMSHDWETQIIIAIRTETLDQVVKEYVYSTKNPIIINLGAGLDTRHLRFKNVKWYQLDLKRPIDLRKLFFGVDEITITKSILDFSWINEIKEKEKVLIIVEGVLMYMNEKQVRSIFSRIGLSFTNSQIVFDTIPKSFVKLKRHKSINVEQAPFNWGNNSSSEIEDWEYGFKKARDYPYLSKHLRRWKTSALLSIFPNIHNGFKICQMQIN
jgi:O-methyltransferase involved in polyketide biosynthesis